MYFVVSNTSGWVLWKGDSLASAKSTVSQQPENYGIYDDGRHRIIWTEDGGVTWEEEPMDPNDVINVSLGPHPQEASAARESRSGPVEGVRYAPAYRKAGS